MAGLETSAADPEVDLDEGGTGGEGAAGAGGAVAAAVGDERGTRGRGGEGRGTARPGGAQGEAALGCSRTGWRGETAMAPLEMARSVSSPARR